jgi:hypothetical protein
MIIWGASSKTVEAGDAGNQHCDVCKERRPFRYVLSYRMRHLYYLIRWSTGKQYFRTCQVCSNSFATEAPVFASAGVDDGRKPKSPIPLFDRWGWAISLGAVALVLAFTLRSEDAENLEDAKMLAAPKVGDRYAVKIEKFMGTSNSDSPFDVNYGVVRVAAVDAKGITLDLPRSLWSRSSKLVSEINDEAKADSYYEGQTVKTAADLIALEKQNVIDDVER